MASDRPFAIVAGCAIEVVAGTLVDAVADVRVAGVFQDDPSPHALAGFRNGVGDSLTQLRAAGHFSGALCETLLISKPALPLGADALLIVGLGSAETFSAAAVRRAVQIAVEQVFLLDVGSAACDFDAAWMNGGAEDLLPLATAAYAGLARGLRSAAGRLRRWSFVTRASYAGTLAKDFGIAVDRGKDNPPGSA